MPLSKRATNGSAAYVHARDGSFVAITPSDGDPERMKAHPLSHIPTTAVHEAIPGHALQFLSAKLAKRHAVRRLIREAGWARSVNVEGWAHYAEELMRAHGFFTPKEELQQLAAQLWRAWRVVVDVGLHAGKLSLEDVARTLVAEAFLPESLARVEAYRYARKPTQAVTYLVGRLQIESLKAEYASIMGPDYKEAEFHRLFLSYGPVPPAMLRRSLLARARRQKNHPRS
jgi:uncharacterized protein (DUF885 family)